MPTISVLKKVSITVLLTPKTSNIGTNSKIVTELTNIVNNIQVGYSQAAKHQKSKK